MAFVQQTKPITTTAAAVATTAKAAISTTSCIMTGFCLRKSTFERLKMQSISADSGPGIQRNEKCHICKLMAIWWFYEKPFYNDRTNEQRRSEATKRDNQTVYTEINRTIHGCMCVCVYIKLIWGTIYVYIYVVCVIFIFNMILLSNFIQKFHSIVMTLMRVLNIPDFVCHIFAFIFVRFHIRSRLRWLTGCCCWSISLYVSISISLSLCGCFVCVCASAAAFCFSEIKIQLTEEKTNMSNNRVSDNKNWPRLC